MMEEPRSQRVMAQR